MSAFTQFVLRKLRGRPSTTEELTSLALREKFAAKGVVVGLYSYGCFDLNRFPAGVTIGRYCSFAPSSQVFLRNHGIDFIALTAYLYQPKLGVVDEDRLPLATLDIADDVWIGHNATILSSARSIGRGGVVAAGAVVTKPVPPYAIVAGNPAKTIRFRFPPEIIEEIEQSRWWELSAEELREFIKESPQRAFHPAKYYSQGLGKNLPE